jgi:sulfur carrier protein
MSIRVNGELQEHRSGETLEDLVVRVARSQDPRGVAVALDDEIVPRSRWKEVQVADESRVEIMRISAGG